MLINVACLTYCSSDLKQGKKEAHVAELFKLVQGHAKSLIFAHDTSRVVQTLMKRGTPQMRDAVFQELRGMSSFCISQQLI